VLDGVPQIPPDIEAAAASELHRLAADLAARSTDRERATGTYLQMVAAAGAAWRAHRDCADGDEACQAAAAQAVSTATADSRRALVRLASTTSDADTYALAMHSCRAPAGQSSIDDCALLNNAQWARIEPDNAVPWLYLAADAGRRRDRGGVAIGSKIAERVGWNDPRLSSLHDEADAMRWQVSQELKSAQEHSFYSCDSLQRLHHHTAAQAQFGESEFLRRELAASGVTTSQAAERRRAEIHRQGLRPTDGSEPTR
jgi:hypothetical protein